MHRDLGLRANGIQFINYIILKSSIVHLAIDKTVHQGVAIRALTYLGARPSKSKCHLVRNEFSEAEHQAVDEWK